MGSISIATWLSLATGWLMAAAVIAVLATGPDETPGGLVGSGHPPDGVLLRQAAGPEQTRLVGLSPAVVTLSPKAIR